VSHFTGQPTRPWQPLLSLVLVTTFLPSCVNWQAHGPAPEAAIRNLGASTVRITRTDGTQLMLWNAVMSGDSIVGGATRTGPRAAVSLADVTEVATPHTDALKTGGMVLGTAGLAALIVGVVSLLTYEDQS